DYSGVGCARGYFLSDLDHDLSTVRRATGARRAHDGRKGARQSLCGGWNEGDIQARTSPEWTKRSSSCKKSLPSCVTRNPTDAWAPDCRKAFSWSERPAPERSSC